MPMVVAHHRVIHVLTVSPKKRKGRILVAGWWAGAMQSEVPLPLIRRPVLPPVVVAVVGNRRAQTDVPVAAGPSIVGARIVRNFASPAAITRRGFRAAPPPTHHCRKEIRSVIRKKSREWSAQMFLLTWPKTFDLPLLSLSTQLGGRLNRQK